MDSFISNSAYDYDPSAYPAMGGVQVENMLVAEGQKYNIQENENGTYSLLRYSEDFKMWVRINFTGQENDLEQTITDYLSKEFLDEALKKTSQNPSERQLTADEISGTILPLKETEEIKNG